MESLRDIRQNIKAIRSTQQIMQTMKMISSARIRKAQEAMDNARPFAKKMLDMVADLKQEVLALPEPEEGKESWASRFFVNKTGDKNKIGLVVITGDKGLAGSFNAVILRAAVAFLKEHQDQEVSVFCIGKKGRDFIGRLRHKNIKIVYSSVGIFPTVTYAHAELLGEVVTDSTKKNLQMRVEAENGATQGKVDLAKLAKEQNHDAIHDTVHEMARDEARHGKAFEGLYNRYFKK